MQTTIPNNTYTKIKVTIKIRPLTNKKQNNLCYITVMYRASDIQCIPVLALPVPSYLSFRQIT
jgi:hypothetical protein